MFSFDRKPAPSPGPQRASRRPAKAPPVNQLWLRLVASSTAQPAGSHGSAGESLPAIQRKPAVSSPGDAEERQADEAADRVLRMAEPVPGDTTSQLECGKCASGSEKKIQARHTSSADVGAVDTRAAVRAAERGGEPLPQAAQDFFGSRFHHDFSGVRVHTDATAAGSAHALNAHAYTVGKNIVFGAGRYAPTAQDGKRLLAHELAHVVQQSAAPHDGVIHRQPKPDAVAPVPDGEDGETVQAVDLMDGTYQDPAKTPKLVVQLPAGTSVKVVASAGPSYNVVLNVDVVRASDKKVFPKGTPGFIIEKKHLRPAKAPAAAAPAAAATALAAELQALIDGATWKEIRKRVYPKESAAGIQRAQDRRDKKLPDLTGLGSLATLDHFVAAVRTIQGDWPKLTADERKKKLGDAVNVELTSASVPAFLRVSPIKTEFKGSFSGGAWAFFLNEDMLKAGTLSDSDAAELANTALHEARHAEQQFLAARFSASQGSDATAIVTEQRIPEEIAKKAVALGLTGATADVKALAKRMFDATVTQGAANQQISDDDGLKEMDELRVKAKTALDALRASATPQTIADATARRDALKAQIKVVEVKYTAYRNIPYEADAHEVGDAAELAFKKKP